MLREQSSQISTIRKFAIFGANVFFNFISHGYGVLLDFFIRKLWLDNMPWLKHFLSNFIPPLFNILQVLAVAISIVYISALCFFLIKKHLEIIRTPAFAKLSWSQKIFKTLYIQKGILLTRYIDLLFFAGISVLPFLPISSAVALMVAIVALPALMLIHYLIPHSISFITNIGRRPRVREDDSYAPILERGAGYVEAPAESVTHRVGKPSSQDAQSDGHVPGGGLSLAANGAGGETHT